MKRKITVRLKFGIIIVMVAVLLCVATIGAAYYIYAQTAETRFSNLTENVAQTVSGFLKNKDMDVYLNGGDTVGYIETNNKIKNLKANIPDLYCIGVYKMTPDGMQVVFDTSSNDIKGGMGKSIDYDSSWEPYKQSLLNGETIADAQILVNSGMALMYCMPVEGFKGDNPVYVCAGVAKDVVNAEVNAFVRFNRIAIIGVTVFLLLVCVVLFEKRIIVPVLRICARVNEATGRADSEYIYTIVGSDLRTGNELENIYKGLLKIYTSKSRVFNAVAKADESSAEAIKSLIKRMDNFTASHLDNSLQYVMLIANELRKKEKFKKLISDKDMEDLMLAAPLHDIGKLVIPPEIIGKPGKLTDDEYEVMKKHSELGGKLIEELYLKNSDESYLHMAKEIAVHHHERWNGSGYPSGLKGEEIPVCVRIMAIADVFDALVSERVYKPAYSFDKSFEMVVNDSGKFFDPEIIDSFIDIKERLREVHQRISNKI